MRSRFDPTPHEPARVIYEAGPYSAIFADEGGWRIDPQSPRQSQHDGFIVWVPA